MTNCGFLKKYDISCSYDRSTNMRVPEKFRTKVNNRKKKNAELDAKDAKNAAEIDKKVQVKKNVAIKKNDAADAAGMSTVGADGKYTKSELAANESIQKNLASKLSSTPSGSGQAAGVMGCFQINSYGCTSFVDATTACNDVNNEVNEYLCSAFSQSLSAYDLGDKDSHILKCISLARVMLSSCFDVDNTDIIPDSGATLTIRKH